MQQHADRPLHGASAPRCVQRPAGLLVDTQSGRQCCFLGQNWRDPGLLRLPPLQVRVPKSPKRLIH